MLENLRKIIKENRGLHIEFRYFTWETDFYRFYKSQTNYNISKTAVYLFATIEQEKRKYTFILSNPSPDAVEQGLTEAKLILTKLPADPNFKSFETDRAIAHYAGFKDSIEDCPLPEKIKILEPIEKEAALLGFDLYGSFIGLKMNMHQLNSFGLDKRFYQSPVMLAMKAISRQTGVAVMDSFGSSDWKAFRPEEFKTRLLEKAALAKLPVIDMEAGDYEAVLGPHAVSQFLEYFSSGMTAAALDQKRSFFEGKNGQKLFPEIFTLSSDPFHPELIHFPYNSDGMLAKKVTFIGKGVFKNFSVDNYYGNKTGLRKNGSVGSNALVMEAGNSSLEELISGVKKGIYVSDLHYMNFINDMETSVTGLTRDGTFLIENGKITKVVNNLRYTEKLSDIFANITGIGDKRYTIPNSENYDCFQISSALMPHVKISKFKVSSSTGTI